MFRGIAVTALCVALLLPGALAQDRVSATQKGSLLVFPKVELRWGPDRQLKQDVFITLSNDFNMDVIVLAHFVSDTGAQVDTSLTLTRNQPVYWAASNGEPAGVPTWTGLGDPYPDPQGTTDKVLRGYIMAWAIDPNGAQIRFNHLHGGATTVNYRAMDAWTYLPYAFQATDAVDNGSRVGTPGLLRLNGSEYSMGFQYLLLDFFACGSTALSGAGETVTTDTDLTLLLVHSDLRRSPAYGYTTKVKFFIWNENETQFSGAEVCATRWTKLRLSSLGFAFLRQNLQTDRGRARISGVTSTVCPRALDETLLGIAEQRLSFWDPDDEVGRRSISGTPLAGVGTMATMIRFTPPGPPTAVADDEDVPEPRPATAASDTAQ